MSFAGEKPGLEISAMSDIVDLSGSANGHVDEMRRRLAAERLLTQDLHYVKFVGYLAIEDMPDENVHRDQERLF